jgi:hypothetical protein
MHPHGAKVGERAELLAQPQESGFGSHRCIGRRPPRTADRPEQYRVRVETGLERRIGERVTALIDRRATERRREELEPVTEERGHRFEAAHALGHDLRTDTVTGEHSNACFHRERS